MAALRPCCFLLVVVLALALGSIALPARAQIGGCTPDFSGAFVYVIETPLGDIPVELYPNMAPQRCAAPRSRGAPAADCARGSAA